MQSALIAQIALGSNTLSESFVARFNSVSTGLPAMQTLEGLWWARDAGVGGFVALSNASAQSRTVAVQVLTATGQAQPAQSFNLPAHSTQMLDLLSLIGQPPSVGDAGGLRLQFDGLLGDVNVTGGLENRQEGYSAVMPFWQAPMAAMQAPKSGATIAHPGIMVGAADSMMGFPVGTRFTPYLALRNLTSSIEQLTLTLYTEQGAALTAPAQQLLPFESRQVDMTRILRQLGMKDFNGALTLAISHSGNFNDVMSAAGSVDAKGTYVFEVDGRAVEQRASKESPYWSVKDGNDTMVALWNPSTSAEDVIVTLKYTGGSGQYHFRVHLAPHATANIDLKEIIANQNRDEDGNLLPIDLQEGSFVFHSAKDVHAPLSLNVNIGIFNAVKGTCYYGSVDCAGYYGNLIVTPGTFSLAADGQVQQLYTYGQYSDGSQPGVWPSYSSSNSSIASVDNGSEQVTAVNAGTATITATANMPEAGEYSGYNPSCSSLQPNVNYTGTATAKVGDTSPVITGIQPSDWQIGVTTAVTITGQSFGTNAPTINFSPNPGISYTLSSYNDTQIVANVNVSSTASGGVINVSVTSNGYNGQGFQSNGNGQSAQSSSSNVGLYQVWNHAEITVIGWVNGNVITLPSGANASLLYDLNHPGNCAVDVGFWALGSRYDLQNATDVAYANAFLLKNSGNAAPPQTITPSTFVKNANSYRLFNDYGAPTGSAYQIGITPDPCGTAIIPNWARAGQPHPNNGATGCGTPSAQCYQLAEGRLGSAGQAVNQTLNGKTTPWIWSVIEFNSSGTPTYSDHAMFPTYSFYQNGVLIGTDSQSSPAAFMANDASYQRTPPQIH